MLELEMIRGRAVTTCLINKDRNVIVDLDNGTFTFLFFCRNGSVTSYKNGDARGWSFKVPGP